MEILNVTGGLSGDSFLFKTKDCAVLFDTAAPVDAEKLIENLEFVLGGKSLDFIFLTHSHYDHLGGVPYLRKKYPNIKVISSEYTKKIAEKESARRAIKQMSCTDSFCATYDDSLLTVDITVCDAEIFDANGINVQAFDAIGHTKCSMVFLVNDEILVANESIGPVSKTGEINCSCILGFDFCLDTIKKCSNIPCNYVIAPHYGIVFDKNWYFNGCTQITIKTKEFILDKIKKNMSFDQIVDETQREFYINEATNQMPLKAFLANIIPTIKNTIEQNSH